MAVRGAAVLAMVCVLIAPAVPAVAEPESPGPEVPSAPADPAAPAELAAPADPTVVPAAATDPGTPPPDDGRVASSPPVSTKSPDGWTLTVSAKDEFQRPVAPLTTAISTREYEVSGVFNGTLAGGDGETPGGVFEVGYQIGCGIDMSTSNGVSLTGTAGLNPSIAYIGLDFPGLQPDGILPGIGANINGGITVGLKPGIINTIPVTKKKFESAAPWVSISKFRIKIDGCVGESFVRSYANLAKSDKNGDAILSWYGVTKAV